LKFAARAVLPLLQFLPDPSDLARYASDVSRNCETRFGRERYRRALAIIESNKRKAYKKGKEEL
jgi:hypothetical protein